MLKFFQMEQEDPNSKDPISHLQYKVDDFAEDNYAGKLFHVFKALNGKSLKDNIDYHDLTQDKEHGYLGREVCQKSI